MIREAVPRAEGDVVRDNIRVHYQVFGNGARAVLLLPTWSIATSGIWVKQVPHLAERYTVIAFDGRGNGGSDRPADPKAYAPREFALDALAILDTLNVREAAVFSMSGGAPSHLLLVAESPKRVRASVFIAPALPITPPYPERAAAAAVFDEPQASYDGWKKWNRHYWQQDWRGFVEFFSAKCLSEPGSEDAIHRWVSMGLETSAEVITTTADAPSLDEKEVRRLASLIDTPVLVVHGSADQVIPLARAEELARLTKGQLLVLQDAGHEPQYRHFEKFNVAVDDFLAQKHYPPRA
jgi:pimeloyl-ACP methyl ester carboxylesterase